MASSNQPINLALIGCGAVSERSHVPAILARKDAKITALVDRNLDRANLLAELTGAKPFATIVEALPHFEAAIVALPHFLHAPASIELLEAGKHVLVEKPMANTSAECDAMIAAGKKGNASLAVGQMRRFCPAVAAAKALIDRGVIGHVRRFEIHEGGVYGWPMASDFFLRKEMAGGGVAMDTGAHTFDMLLWMFGPVANLDYRDDAYGGVEADCSVRFTTASGAVGYCELSRTRNLPTLLEVEGEHGSLVVDYMRNQLTLVIDGKKFEPARFPTSHPNMPNGHVWDQMFQKQLDDWLDAIRTGRPPAVTGEEGRKAVDFINRCYAERRPWQLPWVEAMAGVAT